MSVTSRASARGKRVQVNDAKKKRQVHKPVSLIGPRPKPADRSNERNAKHKQDKTMDQAPVKKGRRKQEDIEEDFAQQEASPNQLKEISDQATKAVSLDKQIEDLNAAAATLIAERDNILNVRLPSLLDSANMSSFDLKDGSSIEIKDIVSGSLPSEAKKPRERAKAIEWLLKNGGKGIIKTSFATEFGVDQGKLVKEFEKLITKGGFAAKKVTGVHPQTLAAFAREKIERGENVPTEKLGLYVGRHAKITLSDEQKAKADTQRVKPKRRKTEE